MLENLSIHTQIYSRCLELFFKGHKFHNCGAVAPQTPTQANRLINLLNCTNSDTPSKKLWKHKQAQLTTFSDVPA